MKWWKRGLFSLISLMGGFVSLDYLILAFGFLTRGERTAENAAGVLWQLAGAGMFLFYAALVAGYLCLVRKNAAFLPAYHGEEKKKQWKGPRMELLLQCCFLLTGLLLRLGYLLYIYLPGKLI